MSELASRVLALETITRTLVSELSALWSEESKGSADWIVDQIASSAVDEFGVRPTLRPMKSGNKR